MDEAGLLGTAVILMLLVVIPVIVLTLVFAWRYRESNPNGRYDPDFHHSLPVEIVVWAVPCVIIVILAVLTWRSSHALDPYKPIESDRTPVTVEAISMDWKWLFIYPDQGVASVNELVFPADTPLNFRITSDTVMNAFFVPELGSQIYAMAGMETKLHLIANEQGQFQGMSSNYSGYGFHAMQFVAHSTTEQGFADWVAKVKAQGAPLEQGSYKVLADDRRQDGYPVTYYSSVSPGLFQGIILAHQGQNHHFGMSHSPMAMAGMAHDKDPAAPVPAATAMPAMDHAGMDHAAMEHGAMEGGAQAPSADHDTQAGAQAAPHQAHAGSGEE